jgi:outer membrane biosynthesis protein TonB
MNAPPLSRPRLPSDRDYSVGLKWSFGAHIGVLALLLIKTVIFPSTTTPYVPTLRVDVVGLPDILKKDLKNAPISKDISDALKKAEQDAKQIKPAKLHPMPESKEMAKPDEMVLKPTPKSNKMSKQREKSLRAALDRMKALASIAREEEKTSSPVIKGNAISKGSSLAGDAKESDQANYYDAVLTQLQGNWALPVWLSRQNLSAKVQVFIDARGRLHGFQFVKLSGNAQFDDAVKRALQESAPFSPPPADVADSVLVNGIIFGFPL